MSKFDYLFDSKYSIIFKNYYGEITLADIRNSWLYAFENQLLPENHRGFVVDYRKATFSFNANEHLGVAEFYKQHLLVFKNCRIAVVTNSPKDIIIPILVKQEDNGYQSMPFSTMEAAIHWVLTGFS